MPESSCGQGLHAPGTAHHCSCRAREEHGCRVAAGGTTLPFPKFSGGFPEQLPMWTLVGGHTAQTTRAITEPVFMRVTESARCSQATTQRCQAGPQHGGDTLLRRRQQQQCRGEAGCGAVLADRRVHQGAGTSYRDPPLVPLGPPRDWPARSNGTSLPAVPGSSQDADDVARPARLPGAGCPCCKAWQFSNFVLN